MSFLNQHLQVQQLNKQKRIKKIIKLIKIKIHVDVVWNLPYNMVFTIQPLTKLFEVLKVK